MARQSSEMLTNQPFFRNEAWFEEAEQTVDLYRKALDVVNKRDLRQHRAAYAELLGDKKVSVEAAQFFYQTELSEFAEYVWQVREIQQVTVRIQQAYQQLQMVFQGLTACCPDEVSFLLQAGPNTVYELQTLARKGKALHAEVEQLRGRLYLGDLKKQQQQFALSPISGMELTLVPSQAFQDAHVVLYNMGDWADDMLHQLATRVEPLKQRALTADTYLSLRINSLSNMESSPRELELGIPQLIYLLFQLDPGSLAAKILLYKRAKAEYLQSKTGQLATTPEALAKQASIKLGELRDVLESLNPESEDIRRYGFYLLHAFGGEEAFRKYLIDENRFFQLETTYWAGKKGVDDWLILQSKLAQNEVNPNEPAYLFPKAAEAEANRQVLKTYNVLADQQLELGHKPGINPRNQQVFATMHRSGLGKIWERTLFAQDTETQYSTELIQDLLGWHGELYIALKAGQGEKAQHRVAAIAANGELLYDLPTTHNMFPRSLQLDSQRGRLLLVSKGVNRRDVFNQIESCRIEMRNRFGRVSQATEIPMKGLFADIVKHDEGYVMALNFFTFFNSNGERIDSKATNGGFNALLVFLSGQGEVFSLLPIFSEEPVFVEKIESRPNGEIRLIGAQGDFLVEPGLTVSGGQVWEYIIE